MTCKNLTKTRFMMSSVVVKGGGGLNYIYVS